MGACGRWQYRPSPPPPDLQCPVHWRTCRRWSSSRKRHLSPPPPAGIHSHIGLSRWLRSRTPPTSHSAVGSASHIGDLYDLFVYEACRSLMWVLAGPILSLYRGIREESIWGNSPCVVMKVVAWVGGQAPPPRAGFLVPLSGWALMWGGRNLCQQLQPGTGNWPMRPTHGVYSGSR